MRLDGWEEALQDEDIADIVRISIRQTFGDAVESDDAKLDLELVDLAVDGCVIVKMLCLVLNCPPVQTKLSYWYRTQVWRKLT